MKLTFRQGIYKAPIVSSAPSFMTYNSDLNTVRLAGISAAAPVIVTTAFDSANYLIQETQTSDTAWGPLTWNTAWGSDPGTFTSYLYWDVNLTTGAITRGFSPRNPTYASTAPSSPSIDQHWFDLTVNKMKVWNGSSWVIKCRVFAGSCASGSITHKPFNSQVAISGSYSGGYIAYGPDLKGIKLGTGLFLTTDTDVIIKAGAFSAPVGLEIGTAFVTAGESISAYTMVYMFDSNVVKAANSALTAKHAIGMVTVDAVTNDAVKLVTHGVVYNPVWNWNISTSPNVYYNTSGALTQTSNSTGPVGKVIDKYTIWLNVALS